MKTVRVLSRSVRDSFKSVFRNFSLSLASISCIVITLIVVAIAIILSYNVNNFSHNVEKNVTIVVFLDVDTTEEQKSDLELEIKRISGVDSYIFQSKTDIADDMMKESKIFENIMSEWTEDNNPLKAAFQVKVKDIGQIGEIAEKIEKFEHVNAVKYGKGMVEQMISVFDIVRKISIGMVVALIVVTAFLISNTIKITIFSRKREIEIMRLVGASNVNIKIPFIFEGLLLGLLGAIIPVIVTVYGYVTLYNSVDGQLFSQFIKLIKPEPFVFYVSAVLILIGVAVGMLGSWRAVRKYLKI